VLTRPGLQTHIYTFHGYKASVCQLHFAVNFCMSVIRKVSCKVELSQSVRWQWLWAE